MAKVYVIYENDDWRLTTEEGISKQLASVKHLNEYARNGETAISGDLEVEEGIYVWDLSLKKYIIKVKPVNANTHIKQSAENTVSNIMKVIGYIIIGLGIIGGFALGYNDSYGLDFNVVVPVWASSFVSGMLFVGFAEVIGILHRIEKKLK